MTSPVCRPRPTERRQSPGEALLAVPGLAERASVGHSRQLAGARGSPGFLIVAPGRLAGVSRYSSGGFDLRPAHLCVAPGSGHSPPGGPAAVSGSRRTRTPTRPWCRCRILAGLYRTSPSGGGIVCIWWRSILVSADNSGPGVEVVMTYATFLSAGGGVCRTPSLMLSCRRRRPELGIRRSRPRPKRRPTLRGWGVGARAISRVSGAAGHVVSGTPPSLLRACPETPNNVQATFAASSWAVRTGVIHVE